MTNDTQQLIEENAEVETGVSELKVYINNTPCYHNESNQYNKIPYSLMDTEFSESLYANGSAIYNKSNVFEYQLTCDKPNQEGYLSRTANRTFVLDQ
jgi:hypothetical protein